MTSHPPPSPHSGRCYLTFWQHTKPLSDGTEGENRKTGKQKGGRRLLKIKQTSGIKYNSLISKECLSSFGKNENNKVTKERFENRNASVIVTVQWLITKVFYNLFTRDTAEENWEQEREREICRFIGIELRLTGRQIKFQLDRKQSDMREVDR